MTEKMSESQMDSLLRVTRTLSDCVPFEEALHMIIEEVRKQIGFSAFAVILLDEETEELSIKIARGISNALIKSYRRPIGAGITARLIWSEAPVLMAAADPASPEYRELRLENDFVSLICVPVVAGGGAVGYMQLERTSDDLYTGDDLRFVQLIANLGAASRVMDALREETERLTFIDPVTNTLKYRTFLRALTRELERATLLGIRTAVGLLDLDNFKPYNEIHGIKEGRRLLAEVATVIRGHIKGIDLVGRIGLDELVFAVFKAGSREEGHRLFDAIRQAVAGCECRGEPRPLATIGGLIIEPDDEAVEITSVMLQLRQALHLAQDAGGNRVHFVGVE